MMQSNFLNTTVQSLSHKWGTDNKEALLRPSTIVACLAVFETINGNGKSPFLSALNTVLSGKFISGSSLCSISWRQAVSTSQMKYDVAPLPLLAMITFFLGDYK